MLALGGRLGWSGGPQKPVGTGQLVHREASASRVK